MPSTDLDLDSIGVAEARRLGLERLRYERMMGVDFLPRVVLAAPQVERQSAAQPAQILRPATPAAAVTQGPSAREIAAAQLAAMRPSAAREDVAKRWKILEEKAMGCQKCVLAQGRTNVVFGTGNRSAQLMFIGEGPGQDEDVQGEPFVGKAGQLLNKIIGAMGFQREDVYLCNIVKCRAPQNRDPLPDEIAACSPYLFEQIELVAPKIIVTLGGPATKTVLNTTAGITSLRGRWRDYKGIPLMPTYHPAYVLQKYTAEVRGEVWADMQQVMAKLK